MDMEQLELNPRIRAAVRRAKLRSVRDVLSCGQDLHTLGLSRSDVQQLLRAAANACRRHRPITALLLHDDPSSLRLSVGCAVLDELLRGGLPVGGVTELSGESGAGKTQLALQLCLSVQYPVQQGGLDSGAVFICTEDSFPSRRLQQLIREQSSLRSDVPESLINSIEFSNNVYIEHAADLDSLQECVTHRVPLLLTRGLVRLVIVDSVAALFRCEFQPSDWLERNKQLISFSSKLHQLSQEHNTPVLCVNQPSVLQRVSSSRSGLGQSGDGSIDAAASPGERFSGRSAQRPPQAGGGVCSSPGPRRTRRSGLERRGPRGPDLRQMSLQMTPVSIFFLTCT
uniref:X-ray repair complementing defective repair in Chinese hamster cells 3 n=1 Tax=Labrus bergylta TaxID=56723 RepID=A0A3Q3F241_9LABR|nr:DNA repair protein XRCC3-like isoform X1 [Labrus bergylta]XP_020514613.1 DNA repair protein XRCC3-like isoform X1 [Labrus bergylta]